LSRDLFYINSSAKFNPLIHIYDTKYNFYDAKFINAIFENELLEAYNKLKNIDQNYTYNKFIAELGQINALREIARKFRVFGDIYKFMYQLNDFSEFKLWEYVSDVELHPMFKKYHKKIYPSSYEKIKILDKNISKEDSKGGKRANNFNLKSEYKNKFSLLYEDFTKNYIDKNQTSFKDFYNVFYNNWDSHNSKIYFFCSTQAIALLLKRSTIAFKNLNQSNIEKSELFYSGANQILLTRTNLSKSYKPFKNSSDEKYLNQEQIEILKRVKNTMNKLLIKN